MSDLNLVWQKTIDKVKNDMLDVSYEVWVATLTPYKMDDNMIYLKSPSEFQIKVIENKYKDLIEMELKSVTKKDYKIDMKLAREIKV